MSSPTKRRDMDLMKLMMSDFQVQMGDTGDFYVKFAGPKDSPYEGGLWRVHVTLQSDYPYKSPSIGFMNKIYHPNVDEASGSVCLDVINQTWSPMYDLVNVFSVFLPQLLLYPNPSDPLNGHAAAQLMKDKAAYDTRVKEYVQKYASHDFNINEDEEDDDEQEQQASNKEAAKQKETTQEQEQEEEEALSDMDDAPEEEVAGELEL